MRKHQRVDPALVDAAVTEYNRQTDRVNVAMAELDEAAAMRRRAARSVLDLVGGTVASELLGATRQRIYTMAWEADNEDAAS